MRESRIGKRVASTALALVLALACGGGAKTGEGEGIVRGVDRAAGRVTLDHGTIPGMMDAMRMDFRVADPTWLDDLEPGDEIGFEVVEENGSYTITSLELLEPEELE